MSDVKKPADRKPKQGTVVVDGVRAVIPLDRLKDWDVLEAMADLNDESVSSAGKLGATVRLMRAVLGEDYSRVKSELREAHDGKLGDEEMGAFLKAVFENLNPNS